MAREIPIISDYLAVEKKVIYYVNCAAWISGIADWIEETLPQNPKRIRRRYMPFSVEGEKPANLSLGAFRQAYQDHFLEMSPCSQGLLVGLLQLAAGKELVEEIPGQWFSFNNDDQEINLHIENRQRSDNINLTVAIPGYHAWVDIFYNKDRQIDRALVGVMLENDQMDKLKSEWFVGNWKGLEVLAVEK